VPERFVADKSAYDLIEVHTDLNTGIKMKKIKYVLYEGKNEDKKIVKIKWCVRIIQEAVITKGLAKATRQNTDEDYYFFLCKEIEGNNKTMRSIVGTKYIEAIEKSGSNPYEVFAKGQEATNESFFVEVGGKILHRNQGSF
jgi:hypothetical protein